MSRSAVATLRDHAALVKLTHSVFALPFALLSLLVATGGRPQLRLLLLVTAAVVAARTSAMAYNRFVDRELDAANPRTANREVPRGIVSPARALGLALAFGAVFLACCLLLSPLCLGFGIPVWLWLLGYSHAKRFTSLCHLWLGIALGLAPVAAWVAADGAFTARLWAPLLLGLGVSTWVAGFDVLYACQDEAFDRAHGLHSLPARLGIGGAMWCSRGLHLIAAVLFAAFGWLAGLGVAYGLGVGIAAALLLWQHWLLRGSDLRSINTAFFTANGMLSLLLFAAGCLDLYLR